MFEFIWYVKVLSSCVHWDFSNCLLALFTANGSVGNQPAAPPPAATNDANTANGNLQQWSNLAFELPQSECFPNLLLQPFDHEWFLSRLELKFSLRRSKSSIFKTSIRNMFLASLYDINYFKNDNLYDDLFFFQVTETSLSEKSGVSCPIVCQQYSVITLSFRHLKSWSKS